MSAPKQKRMRLAAGWVCLAAVLFMHAPLAGAAWMIHEDCCAAGYCKVPMHHQDRQTPADSAAAEQQSAGMHCDHGSSGMTQCTMSCCQDRSQPVLMPVTFVLPAAALTPEPGERVQAVEETFSFEILRPARPASPPPRLAPAVA